MFKRLVLVSRPSNSIEVCRMNTMLRLSVIRSRVNLADSILIKMRLHCSFSLLCMRARRIVDVDDEEKI